MTGSRRLYAHRLKLAGGFLAGAVFVVLLRGRRRTIAFCLPIVLGEGHS